MNNRVPFSPEEQIRMNAANAAIAEALEAHGCELAVVIRDNLHQNVTRQLAESGATWEVVTIPGPRPPIPPPPPEEQIPVAPEPQTAPPTPSAEPVSTAPVSQPDPPPPLIEPATQPEPGGKKNKPTKGAIHG